MRSGSAIYFEDTCLAESNEKGNKMADETKEEKKEEQKGEGQKEEQKPVEEPKVEEKAVETSEEVKELEVAKPTPEVKPDLSAEAGTKAEPTGKFKDLIKEIEGLTTLELAELVKALEERFGVSAAAPVAVSAHRRAAGG